MKLPNSVQEAHPWVINRIVEDFELLDVWALPARGRRDEFDSLIEIMASFDPADTEPITRTLFWLRLRIGGWLGWDDDRKTHPIPGCNETTLSSRLPEELRDSTKEAVIGDPLRIAGFVPLYRTENEWAGEISNATVHGVLHFAWADQGQDCYQGQMAIYVKPRGALGEAYLKLIAPFRHLIVYPALMRQVGRAWDGRVETSA
ncbi:MAG: DUF2867 domain-containing protein [Actinomycetota bacterium]|nr:DUF2867 domain-containing protein [Actinomycetota bacterium]